jgi:uncharacterized membrane protein
MKRISQYFLQGLLFLIPLFVTVYVIYWIFIKIDGILNFPVPGLGFVVTLVFITLIGLVASNFLTKNIVHLVDRIFVRLPLVKMLYTSIKDLVNAFVGDRKSFNRPVQVVIDRENNVRALGFATRDSLDIPLAADPGEVMKLIVSGGVSSK